MIITIGKKKSNVVAEGVIHELNIILWKNRCFSIAIRKPLNKKQILEMLSNHNDGGTRT